MAQPLRDLLTTNLQRVSEWLRFAETKNAAVFAVSASLEVAVAKELGGIAERWRCYLAVEALIFCGAAACISLLSFVPQVAIPWWKREFTKRSGDNLLFFGDAADYAPRDYLAALTQRYGFDEAEAGAL